VSRRASARAVLSVSRSCDSNLDSLAPAVASTSAWGSTGGAASLARGAQREGTGSEGGKTSRLSRRYVANRSPHGHGRSGLSGPYRRSFGRLGGDASPLMNQSKTKPGRGLNRVRVKSRISQIWRLWRMSRAPRPSQSVPERSESVPERSRKDPSSSQPRPIKEG
jgi:hypothetical protein